ncbi:uncharacterized protein LOC126886449 [Diabrotica virgifera virgifera]|uniref:NACHT domain-containing protein n=1 Tax=Diabrotica virgifera virgifera TaxID=50390 RepID=A0ABM5KGL2_DIAVI|nr:uncharacterized protein LOC126886449 [Diabrotica virgifera virgifera]
MKMHSEEVSSVWLNRRYYEDAEIAHYEKLAKLTAERAKVMDSGKAQTPSQGLPYEISLHTLFALSAIESYTNWKLLNEVKLAGKFDDLVFKSDEKCMLLQAKNVKGGKNTQDFMTENPKKSDFSIAKYFLSYLTLKNFYEITPNSLILCTTARLNVDNIMDELPADAGPANLQKMFGLEPKKYRLKKEIMVDKLLNTTKQFQKNISKEETDKDKKEWKELEINREDIQSFICSFVVVKINLTNIKALIVSKLNKLDYQCKFPISSYEYVKVHVEDWYYLPAEKSMPMTKDYFMFILCGEHNRNFLQKLVSTKIYFKESYQLDSSNIFCVQIHDNISMYILKILRSIQKSETPYFSLKENTLCLMQEMEKTFHKMKYTMEQKVICDMMNTFRCDKIKYLIVSFLSLNQDQAVNFLKEISEYMISKKDSKKKVFIIIKEHYLQNSDPSVKIINDKIYFNSLETETKQHIYAKEIQFQGENVTLNNLITKNMNTELDDYQIKIDKGLKKIIFSEYTYSIGSNMQTQSKQKQENYVKRSLMANSGEFPEREFFEKIEKKIVVVTGPPGAGKTTLLKQLVSLKKAEDSKIRKKVKSKLTWIINVDLQKSKQFFRNDIEKTIYNLLCQNENITPDSSYFEGKLIESMGKILIIDGLDENCSEVINKIQNLLADHNSLQALNISLVIMGARDYNLILNLKKLRDLDSCELVKISPFSPCDQSSFFKKYLKQLLPAASIENDLFEKVINLAPAFKDICSTPLSLEMVSKIIKNKISKCDSIKSLRKVFDNVTNTYDFYNCYLQAIKDEFAQDDEIRLGAFDGYIDSLRKFAVKNLFSDASDFNLLGLFNVDDDFEIRKDVLNAKLLKESDEGYAFVHYTFKEYFAAELLWDCLYKKRHSHDLLLEVFNKVFSTYEYKGVCDFFELILEINQNEKIADLSKEYNSALNKVNWENNKSMSSIWTYFFIVKLVFDNYTHFYDILKNNDQIIRTAFINKRYRQSFAKYFVEKVAKVNKVNKIGFIIITALLYHDCRFNLEPVDDPKFESDVVSDFDYVFYYDKYDFNDMFMYGMYDSESYDSAISGVHYPEYAVDFLKLLTREYNIDLNFCDRNGNTISHYAVQYNSLNTIKYLKEQGADLSISNKTKRTLVHEAVRKGSFEVLRYLLEDCKMDVNVSDVYGNLPVHMRKTVDNNINILKYLKEKGANLSISNKDKSTLIHEAARNGAFKVLRYLVEDCKMDLNVSDVNGNLPVHMISMRDYNIDIFKYFKDKGANLSISNKDKCTLVHEAARNGAFDVLRYLVEDCKMDVNVSDFHGNYPVHMLKMVDANVKILKYLKEKGANLSISNKDKSTLIHAAARNGAFEVLRYLAEDCKMDVNVSDVNGNLPVHMISMRDYNIDIFKYLKDEGVNLSISDKDKRTLVHEAARNGAFEVLRYLVEDCKMHVNVSDVNGNLPVHMIKMVDGNVTILKYLKEKGANLSISNKDKHTLIHKAARNGAFKVLRYLVEDCKMDVNVSDVNGNLPVHMISMRDYNIDIFKYLKDKGANLSISNKDKLTLVHKAARNGAFEVLRYLVEDCKMDVNVSDVNGNLPVHMIKMVDGNVKILKYLKEKGANLSISNKDKRTLIHKAARNGAFKVLRYLVEDCKMDVNVSDVNGNLPVHMISIRDYNIDIFKYLKDKGANLHISNKDKLTLVHKAARNGAFEVLRYLVEDCNMDVNVSDVNGNLPVHMLKMVDANVKILKYLKEKGTNLSISNKYKCTLIHEAARNGAFEVLRYLAEDCKMDVNVSDVNGNLPVHMISMRDYNIDIFKYLKDKGANLSISNKDKCTLVHEAARNGAFKVLRYLVEDCKMDVNVSDVNGNLPVHMISMRDYNIDIFKYLKDKGAKLSICNKNKCTLVHEAARNGAFKVLRYLVEDCKMDVNVSDVNGNLPVHMISMRDYNIDIFKYLKDKGANLSISNKDKCTLVHEAARNGAFKVLRYLVEDCKMDVNVSDVNGNLPVHMISMRDYNIDIFKYLKDKGANLSISNKDKRTLLHKAARNGAFKVLRYLVEDCKMDVNVSDVNGNLPVHMISMRDYNIDIFKYLKDKGANLSISNKDKCTLVHEAARKGAFEVLRYLIEDCKMDVNVSDFHGNLPVHIAM